MAETKRMTAEQVVSYLMEEDGLDFLRESLTWVVQQLMEAEVSELVGAGARGAGAGGAADASQRLPGADVGDPGGRDRAGDPEDPPRQLLPVASWSRAAAREQALVAVVQEAYVAGVSTRKVDQVVESLGLRISKSEVSRICAGLDEQVDAFRNRPLEGRYPYLWLDAKVEKVRDGGRVVRKALVLAYAVHESGYREVIGLDVGEAETEAFWRSFLRGLVERGLTGVQLVVSDAHAGLKKAIGAGARLPLAALQRPLPPRSARARPPRAAADAGRADPPDLQRRRRRAGARARSARRSSGCASRCRRSPSCSKRPKTTCSPSTPSRPTTGRSCARRTRSSGSTARSAAAPTSSGSSPTTAR